jgi:CelD/BcsL family acetyltransferase involved in cellulose biosynthesis
VNGSGLSCEVTRGAEPPAGWSALLAAAPAPALVHLPFWHRTLAAHHAGLGSLWALVRLDGRPAAGFSAVLRRRGPFLSLAGHFDGLPLQPIVAADLPPDQIPAALDALLRAAEDAVPAWRRLRVAWHLDPAWGAPLSAALTSRGLRRVVEPVAVLPLDATPEDSVRERFNKNRRQERDQGLARGAMLGTTADPAAIDEFMPIYAESARRWGVAPQTGAFLSDLLAGGEGRCFLTTVRLESALLGAHFCFQDGDRITAWIGASRFDHKRHHPATLLIWGDVLEGCRRGARSLDLGGHGGQEGVETFKHHFGVDAGERLRFERRSALLQRLRGRA